MVGARSTVLALLAVFAVVLDAPQQAQPLVLGWVEAGNGLKVMRHEVTIAQWRQCVGEGACSIMPKPGPAAIDDSFPVTGIGALDAQEFVAWASARTGQKMRLPTVQEWHGFSEVPVAVPAKIFSDPRLAWAATYGSEGKMDPTLRAPGGFGQTSNGIADVKGNVWEWTSSCVVDAGADRCPAYYAAGEHEAKIPVFVRNPSAGGCATGTPPAHLGLRLVY